MIVNSVIKPYRKEFVIEELALNIPFIVDGLVAQIQDSGSIEVTSGCCFLNRNIIVIKDKIIIPFNETTIDTVLMSDPPNGEYQLILHTQNGSIVVYYKSPLLKVPLRDKYVLLATVEIINGQIQSIDVNVPRFCFTKDNNQFTLEQSKVEQFKVDSNIIESKTIQLKYIPIPSRILMVFLNGLKLEVSEYSVTNNIITLNEPLFLSDDIQVYYKMEG